MLEGLVISTFSRKLHKYKVIPSSALTASEPRTRQFHFLMKKLPLQNLIHTASPLTIEPSLFPCCCLLFHSFSSAVRRPTERGRQGNRQVGGSEHRRATDQQRRGGGEAEQRVREPRAATGISLNLLLYTQVG